MAGIDKEVTVNAPIEKVFEYVSYPVNMLEFWPGLVEVKDVNTLPNGGYSVGWVYKMAGIRFEGEAEYTKMVSPHYFTIEIKGGIKSLITWTFRSIEGRTRVTLTIEYNIPIPLLGKLAEAIIVKMNESEAKLMMIHIQTRFLQTNR